MVDFNDLYALQQRLASPMLNIQVAQAQAPRPLGAPAPFNNAPTSTGLMLDQMNRFSELRAAQAQQDIENERARAVADLQMQQFQAELAQQQQKAQAREALATSGQFAPWQQEAIRAGLEQPVVQAALRPPPQQSPMTDIGQINYDISQGYVDPQVGETLKQRYLAGDTSDQFKDDWAAYKDVRKSEQVYGEVANRARQIMAAVENPSGFSDVTLVSNIAKFLDPGSVVRPSETEALNEAGGLVTSIESMLRKAAGKGNITATQRKQIRKMMGRLTDIYETEYNAQRQDMASFMEARGRKPDVMGKGITFPDFTQGETVVSQPVQVRGYTVTENLMP